MDRSGDPRKDSLSGAVLLLMGAGYLWYDLRYPLDTLDNPGPGIFPLAAGLLLVSLAALQLVRCGRALLARPGATPGDPRACPGSPPDQARAERAPWLMVGILVLYLMVVNWMGFQASTFILVVLCSKLMGTPGWTRPIALAAGLLLACHVLFSVWLKLPLPTGTLISR